MTELQKALKIVCIQKNLTYEDVAKILNIKRSNLINLIAKKTDPLHKPLKKWLSDNLEIYLTPKIRAVLNDMTYKEYCKKQNKNYRTFIQTNI